MRKTLIRAMALAMAASMMLIAAPANAGGPQEPQSVEECTDLVGLGLYDVICAYIATEFTFAGGTLSIGSSCFPFGVGQDGRPLTRCSFAAFGMAEGDADVRGNLEWWVEPPQHDGDNNTSFDGGFVSPNEFAKGRCTWQTYPQSGPQYFCRGLWQLSGNAILSEGQCLNVGTQVHAVASPLLGNPLLDAHAVLPLGWQLEASEGACDEPDNETMDG